MDIKEYVGQRNMNKIIKKITPKVIQFKNESEATKASLAVGIQHKLCVFEEAIPIIAKTLELKCGETVHLKQEVKLLKEENQEMKDRFGYVNLEYVKKHENNIVTISNDFKLSKEAISEFLEANDSDSDYNDY